MTLTAEQLQRATQAKSDQLNGCDLLGGAIVAKIVDVRPGSSEQPVIIDIDSWPQPWKPSKTSMRVLMACWGGDPSVWIGRYAVLYCEESVTFGKEAVGGVRTSHLSHIESRKLVSVNATRGKKATQIVEPYYPQEQQAPQQPSYWPDEAFEKQYTKAEPLLMTGEKIADDVIAALETKALLSEGQKARLRRCLNQQPQQDDAPPLEQDGDPFADPEE